MNSDNSSKSDTVSSLSLRTPDQVQRDLLYLQEHRVCESLEFIVKALLKERPDDPILAICNMLRESNRSGSSVRVSINQPIGEGARNDGSSVIRAHQESQDTHSRLVRPQTVASLSSIGTPVAEGGKSFPSQAAKADALIPAALNKAVLNTSLNSRADTPNSTTGMRWGDGSAFTGKLERDESSRSEGSMFSINSIDVSEFLSEFRVAHGLLFSDGGGQVITIQDLADIVDRMTIPIPDIRLLVDLFNELCDASAGSSVVFEAFLARMDFRIQGRYPTSVLRSVFSQFCSKDEKGCVQQSIVGLHAPASVGSNLDSYAAVEMGHHENVPFPAVSVSLGQLSLALTQRLGIRHTPRDLENNLLALGLQTGSTEVVLRIGDFLKLVQSLAL